jgi:hypothetical protein
MCIGEDRFVSNGRFGLFVDWVRLSGAQFVGLKINFCCFLDEWRG